MRNDVEQALSMDRKEYRRRRAQMLRDEAERARRFLDEQAGRIREIMS